MPKAAALNVRSSVSVHQEGRNLGARIEDIDLSGSPNDADIAAIRQALLAHEVLIFRDQDITPDQFMAFGRRFGELTVHPFSPNLSERPELIVLDNHRDNPPRLTDIWHSDETFRAAPPMGTLLRSVITPAIGGDTVFASMTAAYEGLDDRTRTLLSGLEAIHDFKPFRGLFGDTPGDRDRLRDFEERYPLRRHPVVRVHPESGREALFVNRQFTIGIKGMKESESGPLLERLYNEATRPEYQYRLRWQPDTMVFWDNRAVQHYAVHDYFPQRRRMERLTVKGDTPFGMDAGYDGPLIPRPDIVLRPQDSVPATGEAPVRQSHR